MRVTKDVLDTHREGILAAAGKLFRARGVDAVPVAEIMKAAGLTHGGFYGHYQSQAALAASACRRALSDSAARWRERVVRTRNAGESPIEAIVAAYLAEEHVGHPADACAIPALATDAWRAGPPLSGALAEGMNELLEILEREAPAGTPDPHTAALAAMSAMVGGMVVARAADDPAQARATLAAARALAMRAFEPKT
jgi:TetR/AcrR family transcriptional regulator, transcriptional repressor for nem operon